MQAIRSGLLEAFIETVVGIGLGAEQHLALAPV